MFSILNRALSWAITSFGNKFCLKKRSMLIKALDNRFCVKFMQLEIGLLIVDLNKTILAAFITSLIRHPGKTKLNCTIYLEPGSRLNNYLGKLYCVSYL